MNTHFLLPHFLKPVGWVLFFIGFFGGAHIVAFTHESKFLEINVWALYVNELFGKNGFCIVIKNSIIDELLSVCLIFGSVFTTCTRTIHEDEYTAKLRADSLLWAMYFNYSLLLLAILLLYGAVFFNVMICGMYGGLVLFVFRFNYLLFVNSKITQKAS